MANPTLTFNQPAGHGLYPTNETPMNIGIGSAVTVSNSLGTSGRYKLDDVDPASALTEGNLGVVGATVTITPDVVGAYLIGFYDASSGERLAQLAFCVPDADGTVQPPFNATGDETDPATGVITYGNFRPNGVAWAKYKTKGWKALVKTMRNSRKGGELILDLTAGDASITAADLDGVHSIVAVGGAVVPRQIVVNAPFDFIAGRPFSCTNDASAVVGFVAGGNGPSLQVNESATVVYDSTNGQFAITGLGTIPVASARIPGFPALVAPPAASTFTANPSNGPGATIADVTAGGLLVMGTDGAGGRTHNAGFYRAKSGTKTITMLARLSLAGTATGVVGSIGLYFGETSNKMVSIEFEGGFYNAAGTPTQYGFQVLWRHYSDPVSIAAGGVLKPTILPAGNLFWLRMQDDGANIIQSISINGEAWTVMRSEARGSYLSGNPGGNRMGIYIGPQSADSFAEILSYSETP